MDDPPILEQVLNVTRKADIGCGGLPGRKPKEAGPKVAGRNLSEEAWVGRWGSGQQVSDQGPLEQALEEQLCWGDGLSLSSF